MAADPGLLLLAVPSFFSAASNSSETLDHDLPVLESTLHHLQQADPGFVDWNRPGPAVVYRTCYRQALLASRLADKIGLPATTPGLPVFSSSGMAGSDGGGPVACAK